MPAKAGIHRPRFYWRRPLPEPAGFLLSPAGHVERYDDAPFRDCYIISQGNRVLIRPYYILFLCQRTTYRRDAEHTETHRVSLRTSAYSASLRLEESSKCDCPDIIGDFYQRARSILYNRTSWSDFQVRSHKPGGLLFRHVACLNRPGRQFGV